MMTKTLLTAVLIAVSASATFAKKKQVAPLVMTPRTSRYAMP